MSDEEKPVVSYQDDPWGDGSGEIEFVTEDDEAAEVAGVNKTAEELLAQVAALREQAAAQAPNDVKELRAAVEALGDRLGAPAQPAQQPGESWDDYNSRLREAILGDKPADALREAVMKIAGPDFKALAEGLVQLRGAQMTNHPRWGTQYQRYQGEVEAAVAKRGDRYTNPQVYVEETERVVARHIEDVIADEVKKQLGSGAGTGRPEFSEVSNRNAVRGGAEKPKVRYKITPEHEKRRQALGMTREAYYPRANRGRI